MSHRYSAKLLFRYDTPDDSGTKVYEQRIVILQATSREQALQQFRNHGRQAEYEFVNAEGQAVAFCFAGISDILEFGLEAGEEEVWYDVFEQQPATQDALIRTDQQLLELLDAGNRRSAGTP